MVMRFFRNGRESNKEQRQRYRRGAAHLDEEAEKTTDRTKKAIYRRAAERLVEAAKQIDIRRERVRKSAESIAQRTLAPASVAGVRTEPVTKAIGEVAGKAFDELPAPRQPDPPAS